MTESVDRRKFLSAAAGTAALAVATVGAESEAKRIKVGVIGCGSVARVYFPHLKASPHVEIVSACDIIPERAADRAKQFEVPSQYSSVEQMLAGADFDLFVNLTDMQEHERLNKLAIEAGKHVWSEKPIANSLAAGQKLLALAKEKNVRVWGAPTVVNSPQFAFMAETIAAGKLGRVSAAHATYGWAGPDWADFFYAEGGGSMPDLGVYNLTTLTGLFGPVQSLVAITSIISPVRRMRNGRDLKVAAEDNAMVILEHAGGTLSHMQCGFNYFSPHEHDDPNQSLLTVSITGSNGVMHLGGYDWAPKHVQLATAASPKPKNYAGDAMGYKWEQGASVVAEFLATGKEPLFTPEHALHVVEIMTAARESQKKGSRVRLSSTFNWPIVG
ncbi:MAG: Gfo/Idh/MocA family protein [Planctomycetia bacterium]